MVDFSHIIIFSKYLRGWDAVNGPSYTTQKARTFSRVPESEAFDCHTPDNGIKPTLKETAWAQTLFLGCNLKVSKFQIPEIKANAFYLICPIDRYFTIRISVLDSSSFFKSRHVHYGVDECHGMRRRSREPQIDSVAFEERAVDGAAVGEQTARAGLRSAYDKHFAPRRSISATLRPCWR